MEGKQDAGFILYLYGAPAARLWQQCLGERVVGMAALTSCVQHFTRLETDCDDIRKKTNAELDSFFYFVGFRLNLYGRPQTGFTVSMDRQEQRQGGKCSAMHFSPCQRVQFDGRIFGGTSAVSPS